MTPPNAPLKRGVMVIIFKISINIKTVLISYNEISIFGGISMTY
jgi:hypothetical protein